MARVPAGLALPALVAAIAGAGGFLAGTLTAPDEPATRVQLVACGLAPGPPPFDLPLGRILGAAPAGVSVGPFALGGVAEPVTIRFEPLPEAEEKTARRADHVVTLPVDLDRTDQLDTITVRCRYGELAQAVFRFGPERVELPVRVDRAGAETPAS